MRSIIRSVATFSKWGTLLSTLGFVCCTLVQIYARFFMERAPSWTEEAARLFFVFAIGFSSGLALKSGYYVHFDFLFQRFGAGWQRTLERGIDLATVVLFAVFVFYSGRFVAMGWVESSPSLKFPMAIPFAGMLVMGLSILFFAVILVSKHFKSKTPPQ